MKTKYNAINSQIFITTNLFLPFPPSPKQKSLTPKYATEIKHSPKIWSIICKVKWERQ